MFGNNHIKISLLCVLAVGLTILGYGPAFGANIYVPDSYSTIQGAIDGASDGDTVIVRDGTYSGTGNVNIDFRGKSITVKSENGVSRCKIDCQNLPDTRGFYFHSGETSAATVSGFTIVNGNAAYGGGIYCENSSPTITQCTISNCKASAGNGGGIFSYNGSPSLSYLTVDSNIASYSGGGIYCHGSVSQTISNCTISNNSTTYYYGGGIFFNSCNSPTISNSTISGNSTKSYVNNSSIYGGGICCISSPLTISGCKIKSNISGTGGGIYNSSSNITMSDSIVSNNVAVNGGGISSTSSVTTIRSSTINGNSNSGIYCQSGTEYLDKTIIESNMSSNAGGGIYFRSSDIHVTNCVIANNSVTNGGGGVYSDQSTSQFYNCTLTGNSSNYNYAKCISLYYSSTVISNSIIWTDSNPTSGSLIIGIASGLSITYSDVYGGYSGTGNINSDPLFVSTSDFHLQSGSPCIDTATSDGAQTSDIFGTPRPQGAGYDMGAYEYTRLQVWNSYFAVDTRETPMVGDFNGDGRADIITFTRDNADAVGDVYVSLSDGAQFGGNTKWNDWFAVSQDEKVVIGDFNGDHVDDIATWLVKSTKQVYVATSYGSGMNTSQVWVNSIGDNEDDVIKAADANGDGYCDIMVFSRRLGKVYVALSNGSGFGSPQVWHNFFAVSTFERPEAGDVDGDGKADIITFASDSPTARGDVYVALSTGTRFGDGSGSTKWNDWFAVDQNQRISIGDINGDGRDDFATFLPSPNNQVYVVYSQGDSMSDNYLLASGFPSSSFDQPFLADVNADGKADLVLFRQSEGKVYVLLSQ